MLDGNCRTIRVALLGVHGVGKTSTASMLASVNSFDRLLAGAPRPALPEVHHPSTEFISYVNMDVVLQHCTRAAAHRVFLLDTPSSSEKNAIYRGLLDPDNGAVFGGVHAAIIFSSNQEHADDDTQAPQLHPDASSSAGVIAPSALASDRDDMTAQYLDDCATHNVHVLFIHKGDCPPSKKVLEKISSFSPKRQQQSKATFRNSSTPQREHRSTATVRYIDVDDFTSNDGFVQVAKSFISLVQNVHDGIEASEVEAARIEKEDDDARARELARVPPVPLPPLSPSACEWVEHHIIGTTRDLKIVLLGAPNSGKTTFVTSVVDMFVLQQYVPSSDIEIASVALRLNEGLGLDNAFNITLFDGIEHCAAADAWRRPGGAKSRPQPSRPLPKQVQQSSALLTFIDVSDPCGLEAWKRSLDELLIERPPHVGVIAVKSDILAEPIFCKDALMDIAGDHGAFFAYLDPRNAVESRALIARFVYHIGALENKTRTNLERQRLVHQKVPNIVPHTEEDIDLLFHRYDTRGTGFIELEEARVILSECSLGLFGETFDECVQYVVGTYGPLKVARNELNTPLVSKDQLGLMLCRLNKR